MYVTHTKMKVAFTFSKTKLVWTELTAACIPNGNLIIRYY